MSSNAIYVGEMARNSDSFYFGAEGDVKSVEKMEVVCFCFSKRDKRMYEAVVKRSN